MDPQTRTNIRSNALGEGLWGFGWNLAPRITVLPLLVQSLGGSTFEIGLLATIATAGTLVPQILTSFVVQTGVGKKRFLILFHLFVLIPPWAFMGLATLGAFGMSQAASRIALLVAYGVFMSCIGFMFPVWFDWVAGLFKREVRGRAFGWSGVAAASAAVLASICAGVATDRLPFPTSYALLFFVGAGFYVASMAAFIPAKEAVRVAVPRRLTPGEVFARFRDSLRERNFRRYLVARVLLTAGSGAVAFYAVHFKSADGGGVAEETVISLGAATFLAQILAGYALGRLGDACGHRVGAVLGGVAQLSALVIATLLIGTVACAAVLALLGVGIASGWVSHNNFLFETCPHDYRTAHITVSNLVLAPVTALVPMGTAHLVATLGVTRAFAVCAVPMVAGVAWLLVMVREPRSMEVATCATAPRDNTHLT